MRAQIQSGYKNLRRSKGGYKDMIWIHNPSCFVTLSCIIFVCALCLPHTLEDGFHGVASRLDAETTMYNRFNTSPNRQNTIRNHKAVGAVQYSAGLCCVLWMSRPHLLPFCELNLAFFAPIGCTPQYSFLIHFSDRVQQCPLV